MSDLWLPRLYFLGQVLVVIVCGALIGTGHDSTIMDIFCASAGGLILTHGYSKITNKKTPTDSSDGGA